MTKDKVQDYDSTAANNTDVAGANIDEGCSPAGINNAIRALMSHIKAALSGADDSIITGTAGSDGNFAAFNADGDLVAASGTAKVEALANDSTLPTYTVTDFDTALESGFIYAGAGASNAPSDLSASAINGFVSRQGDNDLLQVVVGQSITRMYWRLRNGGTWSSWERAMRFSDVLDEDDMASDDADMPPSQQSVKAYVDTDIANVIAFGSVSDGNFTVAFDEGCTITRTTTGQYTVTFDAAEPDANYAVVATLLSSSGGEEIVWVDSKTTTAFDLNTYQGSAGYVNRPFDVVVYRLRS